VRQEVLQEVPQVAVQVQAVEAGARAAQVVLLRWYLALSACLRHRGSL
jgi:hypothetical protein